MKPKHKEYILNNIDQKNSNLTLQDIPAQKKLMSFLLSKLQKKENIALTWVGDGSTRTTAFHEGMMCAKSLSLPLVVFVQDNQIALGTPLESHSAETSINSVTLSAAIARAPRHATGDDRMTTLFESQAPRPLADRLRPKSLAEVVGQDHLIAPDGPVGHWGWASRPLWWGD